MYFDTKVFRSTMAGLLAGVPVIVHQGGTYSGKTFSVLAAVHQYLAIERARSKMIASIVSCTIPHLKRGALRDWTTICDACGGLDTWQRSDNLFTIGSSLVEFFSADDDGKVRGGKRDILFVNEGNLINFERYRQLAFRTRATVIIDYNPVSEFWLHEHIIRQPGVLFKRSTYHDNPTTPQKVKDDVERLKDIDEQLYRVYALGLTGRIQGLIYPHVELVDAFPDEARKTCYGLDFGFTNDPTALVRFGEHSGAIYADELIYETGMTNQDISRRMKDLGIRRDDEIFADAAEPKSIEELRRDGWNVRAAKKGPDSVRHGILLLKERPLRLTKRSVNMDKERRNYRYKTDKDGRSLNEPIDLFNHGMDALRYAASMKLTPGALRFAR